MPELNFPDPAVTNPFTAPNGTVWNHDGGGWVRETSGGSGIATSTGYKNVIINGRLGAVTDPWVINQRTFDGNWPALGDGVFGYDRWKKIATGIEQRVENANVLNELYTLSWEGGGSGSMYDSTGTAVANGPSPLTGILSLENIYNRMLVPDTSYNIQLELGSIATSFEIRPIGLEKALCQRHAYVQQYPLLSADSLINIGTGITTADATVHLITVELPVSLYKLPTFTIAQLDQLYIYAGGPASTFRYLSAIAVDSWQDNKIVLRCTTADIGFPIESTCTLMLATGVFVNTITIEAEII